MLIFYLFSTPEQAKKFRTESERNVRRKLAFDELKNERDLKQKGPSSKPCASGGSSEESEVFIKIVQHTCIYM